MGIIVSNSFWAKTSMTQNLSTQTFHYTTKNNQRVEQRVPVHLPSRILSHNFKDFKEPMGPVVPALESARLDCARWRQHSVRQKFEGKYHWSRIVPGALYWDGVQFQNRDSFFCVCLRDLRTNTSHVCIILRHNLN